MTAGRRAILAVCILGFMQTHIHRVGFAPLIPSFIADLGMTYAAAGTIMASYFWSYTAVQVPIGILSDRWGSRRVMLAFLSTLVLGIVGFVASQSYAQSLVARCVIGLGTAGVWLPGIRLIHERFPIAERGQATGLFSAGGGLGGTAALVFIPLFAESLGWRVGYGLLLIPLLVTLALVFALIPRSQAGADGRSAERVAGVPAPEGGDGALAVLGRALCTRALWPFNVAVLFSYGGYVGLITWLPTFLVQDEGLSRPLAGLVTGLMTAGTIVSWPLAGLLSDRLGRRKPLYLASQGMSALACLGFATLVPGTGALGAGAVALATGLLLGGMVTPFVMVAELVPPGLVGTASGVVNTFCFIGALLVPVGLGYVLDATGSFPAAFLGCAATQALALGSAGFTRETGRARAMMAS